MKECEKNKKKMLRETKRRNKRQNNEDGKKEEENKEIQREGMPRKRRRTKIKKDKGR